MATDNNRRTLIEVHAKQARPKMAISIKNRQRRKVDISRVRRSLKKLLKALGFEHSQISLLLVNDRQIREINKKYLRRDRPTNVISFAMTEGPFGDIHPEVLGDIILSVETAARDSLSGHIDFMDEVEFLLIHGLLHLLGYNHENTDADTAERMKTREHELFYMLRHYDLD